MPHRERPSERHQLELFRPTSRNIAPRDAQDLMAYPFFSLAKSRRTKPIDFRAGDVSIRVDADHAYGMATIWDADVLIWAASQIVDARDAGFPTSRLMATTPHEILTFIGRGTSVRDYVRLKAALDRLQATTIATSIRQPTARRMHRFSWINEWKERADRRGRVTGVELILPDWFYSAVLDDALVLTIDPAYFGLLGGLERWLYRVVRKHGGHQRGGWQFDLRYLYMKSGSLSPFRRFAFELRDLVRRQPLPGYRLNLVAERKRTLLTFAFACGQPVQPLVLSETTRPVLSGTPGSCHREQKSSLSLGYRTEISFRNLESNQESNLAVERGRSGDGSRTANTKHRPMR